MPAAPAMPSCTAFSRTRAVSMPRPSSVISTTTLPPCWRAAMDTRPRDGLPWRTLSSGNSMPWSMQLRMRCVSGSDSASRRPLSISVSSPERTSSMDFPVLRDRSRTIRGNLLKMTEMGTMRVSIMARCMPPAILSRESEASASSSPSSCTSPHFPSVPGAPLWAGSAAPFCIFSARRATRDLRVTSSATRLHRSSSLRVSTRIVGRSPEPVGGRCAASSPGAAAGIACAWSAAGCGTAGAEAAAAGPGASRARFSASACP